MRLSTIFCQCLATKLKLRFLAVAASADPASLKREKAASHARTFCAAATRSARFGEADTSADYGLGRGVDEVSASAHLLASVSVWE